MAGRHQSDVELTSDHIAAVEPDLDLPNALVIDVAGSVLLPKAIGAHVHPVQGNPALADHPAKYRSQARWRSS